MQSRATKFTIKGFMSYIPPKILTHGSDSAPSPIFLSSYLQVFTKNIAQTIFLKKNRGCQTGTVSVFSYSLVINKSIWICAHPIHFLSNSTDNLDFLWSKTLSHPVCSLLFEFTSSCFLRDFYLFITNCCTFRLFFLLNS